MESSQRNSSESATSKKDISIHELKATLAQQLRRVQRGEVLVVTRHGKPIARLVPMAPSRWQQLAALREAGVLDWNGQLFPREPVRDAPRAGKGRTVAGLLIEDRG